MNRKKHSLGALALFTAVVLGGCLNSHPLYAMDLAGEARLDRTGAGQLPVTGQVRLLEGGQSIGEQWQPGPLYDQLQPLFGDLWLARRQDRYGVLDSQGNILAPLVYPDAFSARRAAYGIQVDESKTAQAE